ncbi:MAG: amidohydrolase family protein, partial [Chloroflexi bacterium]|nr:amidohydrolase family protein [Chloroflexota bacterium]
DVAVHGDRVTGVGEAATRQGAARVVEADGLALAPGFIDMHSHADHTLPANPAATNSITQGVTTELIGLCGFSVAPLSREPGRASLLRDLAAGIGPDLRWAWHSFADFLDALAAARPAVNVAPLVGHHALRILAMGIEDRPPTPLELQVMRAALAEALDQGAWGMSSGLVYVPGQFADLDELVALGQELRRVDGIYVSHLRDESDHLLDAVDEAVAIGQRNAIRAQVSHLKITAQRNAGRIGAALQRLVEARRRGVRAHADVYPYVAGSTYLHQVLPPWIKQGGLEAMVERLKSDAHRLRARHDIETSETGWANQLAASGGWHNILVTTVRSPARRAAEGRRIADLAVEARVDPLDYAMDLLIEDRGGTTMVVFHMAAQDMQTALSWEFSAVGSDQLGVTSPSARVHPRAYGTFVRVLGWAVREAQLFPLSEAVRKMTGLPAEILGLKDRGRIAPGMLADLVLFDPATVADAATYEEPTRTARGIEQVMLGGELAVEHGRPVRLDLGQVLRAPSRTH